MFVQKGSFFFFLPHFFLQHIYCIYTSTYVYTQKEPQNMIPFGICTELHFPIQRRSSCSVIKHMLSIQAPTKQGWCNHFPFSTHVNQPSISWCLPGVFDFDSPNSIVRIAHGQECQSRPFCASRDIGPNYLTEYERCTQQKLPFCFSIQFIWVLCWFLLCTAPLVCHERGASFRSFQFGFPHLEGLAGQGHIHGSRKKSGEWVSC